MGLANLLLSSIFFTPREDIPLYENAENIERSSLYHKANDVGTSGFQTYLSDPQPALSKEVAPVGQCFRSHQKPILYSDSINYFNERSELLGGFNVSSEEQIVLFSKYNKDFGSK